MNIFAVRLSRIGVHATIRQALFPEIDFSDDVMAGSYETWICATCGYTEWYAQDDPQHYLDRLARLPGSGVRLIEGKKEPYR